MKALEDGRSIQLMTLRLAGSKRENVQTTLSREASDCSLVMTTPSLLLSPFEATKMMSRSSVMKLQHLTLTEKKTVLTQN